MPLPTSISPRIASHLSTSLLPPAPIRPKTFPFPPLKGPLYAVIHIRALPLRIQTNATIILPHIPALRKNQTIKFTNVREIGNNTLAIRAPEGKYIATEWTNIEATVLEHTRAKKLTTVKFKRRKNYKRTIGRREWYTVLKTGDVQFTGNAVNPIQARQIDADELPEIPETLGEEEARQAEHVL